MDKTVAETLQYPFDGRFVMSRQRRLRKLLRIDGKKRLQKHIAVLGGSTTEKLVDLLDLFLLSAGIEASFYQCDYAQFWEAAVFDNPELDQFDPDLIIVHTSVRNLRISTGWTSNSETLVQMLEDDKSRFTQVWDALSSKYSCPIIQNNFEHFVYRMLGNSDASDTRGISSYVRKMNDYLYDYVESHSNLYVHDIEYLSARIGLRQWHDADSWYLYKSAFAMSLTPEVAYSLSHIVKALYGLNKKVVVLDLDNTLWKGVVGDDGVEGIVMGPETAVGEKYRALQEYLRHLPEIGVILAINSKNDEENALAGLRHEDSLLPPESFAAIEANWNPKSENMKTLSEVLNLGLDSFVFVDDNPAERQIITMEVPDVTNLPFDDINQVVSLIDDCGFFETVTLTDDDVNRAEMYRNNARRSALQQSVNNYDDYLIAMQIKCQVHGFDDAYIARIAQLTNKTNQFNLTTCRFTEDDIRRFACDDNYLGLSFRLSDRFGDNGLISVLLGELQADVMHIRLWLMSCRVFNRGVEFLAFNSLAEESIKRGALRLCGYYYPTKKNGIVRNLFETIGFTCISLDDEGNSVWEYNLKDYAPLPHHISIEHGCIGA